MKMWYEVFISGQLGTMTVAICKNIKEAKKIRKEHSKIIGSSLTEKDIHIDKWENIDNPKCIGEII